MGLMWMVAGMVGLVAGVVGVRLLLQPPSELRLTVFRPWRGDPWPHGVQEDDDARFDWSGPKRRRASIRLGWEDPVEDLSAGAVIVEPIDSISVRHRPH